MYSVCIMVILYTTPFQWYSYKCRLVWFSINANPPHAHTYWLVVFMCIMICIKALQCILSLQWLAESCWWPSGLCSADWPANWGHHRTDNVHSRTVTGRQLWHWRTLWTTLWLCTGERISTCMYCIIRLSFFCVIMHERNRAAQCYDSD